MQTLRHLPTLDEIGLPKETAKRLLEYFTQPFSSLNEAADFWLSSGTTAVIITAQDNLPSVFESLTKPTLQLIELAETQPEFTVPLPNYYQLSLVIINDYGSGCYLIKPTGMLLTTQLKAVAHD